MICISNISIPLWIKIFDIAFFCISLIWISRYLPSLPSVCQGPAQPAQLLCYRGDKEQTQPGRARELCENAARGARGPRLNKGVDRLSWGCGQRNFLDISTDRWRWSAVSIIVYTALALAAGPARASSGRTVKVVAVRAFLH